MWEPRAPDSVWGMTSDNPTASTPDLTAAARRALVDPAGAPADVAAHARASAHPALTAAQPRRRRYSLALGIVGVIVLAVLSLIVTAYLIGGLGPDAFALGGIMALVPLAIVFLGARWIDRWEPEPRLAVIFAFLWGSAAAVLIALVVGSEVSNWVTAATGLNSGSFDFFASVIQAPIVEEAGKGLGILLIFLVARKFFDGPVDGVVYAAWVAGGFAFTENILYFGGQLLDVGGLNGSVYEIFLIRGFMSPFAHVMFTMCTGIALGIAARRGYRPLRAIGVLVIGLIPAILLHALWNGALYFVYDFYGYYAIVQFPLFVIAVLLVVNLRRQEAKLTFDRLSEYANVGWFRQDEVAALATAAGRRVAISWAKRNGRSREMKQYIADATKLAFARQRIVTERGSIGAAADEAALLGAIVDSRTALVGTAHVGTEVRA